MSTRREEASRTNAEITREIQNVNKVQHFFETRIIAIPTKVSPALVNRILITIDTYLRRYGIQITGTVTQAEYQNMTSSKAVNRYIQVRRSEINALTKEIQETIELIKIGESKFTLFDIFASVKYCFVSLAETSAIDGEPMVAIWIHTHSRLYNVLEEFMEMPFGVAQLLSASIDKPVYILGTSPLSKSRDEFAMFRNGYRREARSGRYLLTTIRDEYGINIVDLMGATDLNASIMESLNEWRNLRNELELHKGRIKTLEDEISTNTVLAEKCNEKGEKIVDILRHENENMTTSLNTRIAMAKELARREPIGEIIYFKIDALPGQKVKTVKNTQVPGTKTTSFGRKTDDTI